MSDEGEIRRLRWRCRRGMRELDQLLLRYLERRWPAAGEGERAAFERLLDCEDDRLWRWFLSREAPEASDLKEIVARVLELA